MGQFSNRQAPNKKRSKHLADLMLFSIESNCHQERWHEKWLEQWVKSSDTMVRCWTPIQKKSAMSRFWNDKSPIPSHSHSLGFSLSMSYSPRKMPSGPMWFAVRSPKIISEGPLSLGRFDGKSTPNCSSSSSRLVGWSVGRSVGRAVGRSFVRLFVLFCFFDDKLNSILGTWHPFLWWTTYDSSDSKNT